MSTSKSITILGTPILPGKRALLNMNIARLHTGTPVDVPVIVERAKKEGPCLLLSAGIHGDEINGVEIVRQIIASKYNKPEAGTVICIPVINVFGFINQSRSLPDGRDLNRVFPGGPSGSLASRVAHALMTEIVPHIDYCVDYHTGGASRFNYTQVRVDGEDKETLSMAKNFGAQFILMAKNREKSFRESVTKLGKKVLLFEGGKALNLDRRVTQVGINGALRIMNHLGMRSFEEELRASGPSKASLLVKDSGWVRAKHAGMFRSKASLGSYLEKGSIIGSISDPFGHYERLVKAPHSGYVICNNHAPIVNQGDALAHLTKETEEI